MSKTITIQRTVEKKHTAIEMKSGSLEVLATPQMIAWMEEASCQLLELEPGMTSVGTKMNVSHDKASPIGAAIEIKSTLVQQENRKLVFYVEAYQEGVCIGKGDHERFIVNSEKFLKRTYGN